MRKLLCIFFAVTLHFFCTDIQAQVAKDSASVNTTKISDSSHKKTVKKFDPRIATKRSAMIPGWGQIYNKKYWKLPLVYGALGITASIFVYNIKTYKALRLAYTYKADTILSNDALIDDRFKSLSAGALQSYRNSFRQNVDYSALFFIIFWGLNVVDATVDGHLKQFDVNDNLTLHLTPGYSPMANTTGLSFVFDIHSRNTRAAK